MGSLYGRLGGGGGDWGSHAKFPCPKFEVLGLGGGGGFPLGFWWGD